MTLEELEVYGKLAADYTRYSIWYFVRAIVLMLVMVTFTTHRTEPGLGVGFVFGVCISIAALGGFIFGIVAEILKRKFLRSGGTREQLVLFQVQRE